MTREAAAHELVVSAVAYYAEVAWDMPEVTAAASIHPDISKAEWKQKASQRVYDAVSPYNILYAARLAWYRAVKGEAQP